MSRKGVSKQQIFEIAKEMVFSDQLPTAIKIRAKLTTGSMATIQKYLQEWKKTCFSKASIVLTPNTETQEYHELIEEKRVLTESFNKQTKQNEYYAQELINAEKANIALKEENRQLQIANQESQLRITGAEAANNALERVTQKIQNELDFSTNETIQKMQQTIDDLRAELKKLNETSLSALRDTSTKGHEVLMQEKVISINLQAKIDSLNKELLESNKQLNATVMKSQVQTGSLLRQIEQLEKIIQEHLSLEKLLQLEKAGVRLNSNIKVVAAAYGK